MLFSTHGNMNNNSIMNNNIKSILDKPNNGHPSIMLDDKFNAIVAGVSVTSVEIAPREMEREIQEKEISELQEKDFKPERKVKGKPHLHRKEKEKESWEIASIVENLDIVQQNAGDKLERTRTTSKSTGENINMNTNISNNIKNNLNKHLNKSEESG